MNTSGQAPEPALLAPSRKSTDRIVNKMTAILRVIIKVTANATDDLGLEGHQQCNTPSVQPPHGVVDRWCRLADRAVRAGPASSHSAFILTVRGNVCRFDGRKESLLNRWANAAGRQVARWVYVWESGHN